MTTAHATDTLVLTDEKGNYYVIPRQVIEAAKVTDEKKKQELHQSIQSDTSGFAAYGAAVQNFQLGASKFKGIGSCACNWTFDQSGRVKY